jgi:hypothetical protein
LSDANLKGATFLKADMNRVNLDGATLTNADLSDAVLHGSTMLGAYCANTNFGGAKIARAYLSYARLTGANFQDAELVSSELVHVDWERADVKGAMFGGLQRLTTLEKSSLKDLGARFLDSSEYIDSMTTEYEQVCQHRSAREDFNERLTNLESTYRRSNDAFERYQIYQSNRDDNGTLLDEQAISSWQTVRNSQRESLRQAREYGDSLDYDRFTHNVDEFAEKLRGLHRNIEQLSEYRKYYEQLWSSSNTTSTEPSGLEKSKSEIAEPVG